MSMTERLLGARTARCFSPSSPGLMLSTISVSPSVALRSTLMVATSNSLALGADPASVVVADARATRTRAPVALELSDIGKPLVEAVTDHVETQPHANSFAPGQLIRE